ncbi:MAG TPA: hypothetical protein VHV77_02425 [Pirellulales bacterium]|jgi:hypothetical protein|nr:hypothetical protein [Pirellulales bacterium]
MSRLLRILVAAILLAVAAYSVMAFTKTAEPMPNVTLLRVVYGLVALGSAIGAVVLGRRAMLS